MVAFVESRLTCSAHPTLNWLHTNLDLWGHRNGWWRIKSNFYSFAVSSIVKMCCHTTGMQFLYLVHASSFSYLPLFANFLADLLF